MNKKGVGWYSNGCRWLKKLKRKKEREKNGVQIEECR